MSIVVDKKCSLWGLFEFMQSKKCCVRLVSRVFVECSCQNQCCVGARGTSGYIMFSIRYFVILDDMQAVLWANKKKVK